MPSPQYLRGIGTIWAGLGIVRWKAVSKHATCGTPGMALADRLDQRDLPGQVFRVEGAIRRSWSSISAVTSAGSTNRSPPWTTRCPTAAIAASPGSRSTCSITRPAAAAWSGASTARSSRRPPSASLTTSRDSPRPTRSTRPERIAFDRVGRREDGELQAG